MISSVHTASAPSELLPCPFCGEAVHIRKGVNAYGHCKTGGCHANRAQIVPLDDQKQVDAWNRRAQPADGGVEEAFRAGFKAGADPEGLVYAGSAWVEYQALATREEAPAEAGEQEIESEARKWIAGRYPNDAPSDLAYDASEMVDAFMAGRSSALRAQPPAREDAQPMAVTIFCPNCALPHVDEGEWATTRHHKTHQCQGCGHEWRPFPFPTVGVTHPTPDAQPVWVDGVPTKHHAKEWFIAETAFGDRVVLTALPEEYAYDFKTADETYIKADRIKRWMPFPDSQYLFPHPAPDALREFGKHRNLELSYRYADEDDDGAWLVHRVTGGRNDREWTQIGSGETPSEAINQALAALQAEQGAK